MVKFFQELFNAARQDIDIPDGFAAYNKFRNTKDLSAVCYAPSVNMLFSQTGQVQVCCHNTDYFIGKYPEQNIHQIWNSEEAEILRGQMQQYKLPKSCKICQSDIETGAFQEVRARQFDDMQNKNYPAQMEFLISNVCNLECVMCKGEYSSLIRQNRDKLPPIKTPYDDNFVEQLKEFIPHLREARFSGSGEAFLIDLNYKIWDLIIELNPKCIIMVQTNGTVLNERIKDLMTRGNFQIGISLDSIKKEVYESIRLHARFERVIENIAWFSEYSQANNRKFSLSLCIMRQNWSELPAYINFANSYNAFVTFHKVWHPLEYSLNNLPYTELENIEATLISQNSFRRDTPLKKHNARHYEYMCKAIGAWKEKAASFMPADMTNIELQQRILSRVETFFEEEKSGAIPLSLTFEQFLEKFDCFINLFNDEDFKRRTLILLSYERVIKIYQGFENMEVDELYALAKKNT